MKIIITAIVVILGMWIKPIERWILYRAYYQAEKARKRGEVE
jgi:hypothetical protein